MKIPNSLIPAFLCISLYISAQNPSNITFPTPTANPPSGVISYTRAANSINLLPGFIWSAGANDLLNLSIGNHPTYISSGYLGSGIAPGISNCTPLINQSLPVGETKGNFAVSPSGAATYNIPIIISPGTKGVQPELSIAYNSQKGVGLMGNAWSLVGLSEIERTSKTLMHDGVTTGPALSAQDVFALDGQRLFALSGTYGQNGTTYYTESETFCTVTSYNSQGNGPQWFQVKDKFGNTLDYGSTADSRLTGIGDNTVLSWNLKKHTDEFGNYMLFNYTVLNGEVVLDNIEYTGNAAASLAPYNKVVFEYIDLAEKTTYFINGKEFRKTKLLKTISSYAGNDLVRRYKMEYEFVNGTYLALVREVESDYKDLNVTSFCWDDPAFLQPSSFQNSQLFSNASDYTNMNAVPADMDGDGFNDYACVYSPGGGLKIMHNDFKANFGTSNAINFTQSSNTSPNPFNARLLFSNVTDDNMDNKQEVITVMSDMFGFTSSPLVSKSYTVKKITMNPSLNVTNVGTFSTTNTFPLDFKPFPFFFDTRDYSGDGLNDVLRIDPEGIRLTSSFGAGVFAITTTKTFARPFAFNNDGIGDYIILENQTSTQVNVKVVSLVSGVLTQIHTTSYSFPTNTGGSQKNMLRHFGLGDFNGDGLGDLVYINDAKTEMFICRGTGTGFQAPSKVNSFTALPTTPGLEIDIQIVDINGDGKTDINIIDNSVKAQNNPVNNYFVYFSRGDLIMKGGSFSGDWTRSVVKEWVTQYEYGGVTYVGGWEVEHTIITGFSVKADLNGDGIYDYTSFNPSGQDWTVVDCINGRARMSILGINTGLNRKLDIRYANLNSEMWTASGGVKQEIYKKQSTTTYAAPLFNYKPNIFCVHSTEEMHGMNMQLKKRHKYVYTDAIFHKNGRGSLGFEKVMSFDRETLLGFVSTMSVNTSYMVPVIHENVSGRFTITSVNGISTYNISTTLMSKALNTISLVPRNSQGYFISMDQKTVRDYLKSTQSVASISYNLNNGGNISSVSTSYGWPGQTTVKTTLTSNSYVLNNGSYKIQSVTNTQTQNGEPSFSRTTNYNYDAQGHLTSIVNDPTFGNQMLTTTYSQFNAFGRPTKTSISAGDVSARNSEVIYDATGRFITKRINAINNFKEFAYDPKYGSVIQETGISGLVTNFSYDGQGRLVKTVFPNQAVNKVTYAWDDPGTSYSFPPMGLYSIKTELSEGNYIKVYYCTDGQELRRETLDHNGQVVISDTKYVHVGSGSPYPPGTVIRKSEPHYVGQQKYMVSGMSYETTFFRPLAQTTYTMNGASETPAGISRQNLYSNPSTDLAYVSPFVLVTDQNNVETMTSSNSGGQVTSVQNNYNNGLIQNSVYSYHSSGQPKSINLTTSNIPSQNITTTFSYNNLGHRTQIVDPSSGTITYAYNTLGEVTQYTTPPGKVFTYTYDNLGRKITKTGNASGTTTYQYVTANNGKEKIDKIFGPNSTAELKYDNFGRLIETKETIGTKVFTSQYTLDNFGRETQHTYPGGYIIKKTYNSLGQLITIRNNSNQLIWQLNTMDALGRIREYDYGNGLTAKNTYDDLNNLVEIDHENGTFHRQTYEYYPTTASLKHRIFNNYVTNTDLKEVFTFDAADRLTQAKQVDYVTNNQIQVNNMGYTDGLGNITFKSDAGTLQYNNMGSPFLLTGVVNQVNNISLNTLNLAYTDFNKVSQIQDFSTPVKQMDFVYGVSDERIKMEYSIGGTNQYTRYYHENYDRQETGTGYKEWNYIHAPSGLCAIYYNNNGSGQLLYPVNDKLGSPILLTAGNQSIVESYSFDSWGRRRNPNNWSYSNIPAATSMIRGYTSHEHLDEFSLINMNGRIYEPVTGRFIQPDKYVQTPQNLQNFNRYSYCINNPLKYTDPSGNIFGFLLFATKQGYWLQKQISPVAVKVNIKYGTHQKGLGFDMSLGVPQSTGLSYRYHFGRTYYWKNYGEQSGWERREGGEWSLFHTISYSGTTYSGNTHAQTTNQITIGNPLGSFTYDNDTEFFIGGKIPGVPKYDGDDRYRTAAGTISMGPMSIGLNLHTGEPGTPRTQMYDLDGNGTFETDGFSGGTINDPNQRNGVLYLGIGPIKIGMDSEKIRHQFQNRMAHDHFYRYNHGEAYWWVIPVEKEDALFLQFDTGTGNSEW